MQLRAGAGFRPLPAASAGLVLLVALSPPLDGAAERSLTAHMVQHLLLLVVVAPLAALALSGLRPAARSWTWWAAAAVVAHGAALLGWHLPALYDAAQRNLAVHGLEHSAYLAGGLALWLVVLPRRGQAPAGPAVLVVFLAGVPCTLLGAAMTTAGATWYASYAGSGGLGSQHMAGAVMWGFGGLAYLALGIGVFATWLRLGGGGPDADATPSRWTAPRPLSGGTVLLPARSGPRDPRPPATPPTADGAARGRGTAAT